MRVLWAIAWRNLWRHKRRSLITAFAMASAVALCMAMIAFTDGTYAKIFELAVEQQLGHAQVNHPDYPGQGLIYDTLPEREALLARIDAQPGTVAASPRIEGFALLGGNRTSAGAQLLGIPPARDRRLRDLGKSIVHGRFLADDPAHEVVLGYQLAEEIEVGVGDEIVALTQATDGSLGNDLYTVVGLFRTGSVGMDQGAAFLHIDDVETLLILPDQAHGITILTDDADAVSSYVQALGAAIDGDGVEVQPWWEASPATAEMMGARDATSVMLMALIFLVSAFGVVNTMLMSVFERTRELGMVRALGMRPGGLVALVVLESLCLGALACGIGLVLGGIFDWLLVVYGVDLSAAMPEGMTYQGVQFDPVMKAQVRPGAIIGIVVSVFVVSVVASLWPAWRAASLDPVDAMREA